MSQPKIPRWLGMGAALAWVAWSATSSQAQVQVRLDLNRHPGASVRFGAPPPRPVVPVAPVVPVVPPGSVRYEHYRGREHDHDWDRFRRPPVWPAPRPGVVYRHPYSDVYLRRFRPGWRPIVVGTTQYYVYPALPMGVTTVVVNGVTYYLADGVYYQPSLYEGQTVYMVVPPPIP
jgi:hypothetical protein